MQVQKSRCKASELWLWAFVALKGGPSVDLYLLVVSYSGPRGMRHGLALWISQSKGRGARVAWER